MLEVLSACFTKVLFLIPGSHIELLHYLDSMSRLRTLDSWVMSDLVPSALQAWHPILLRVLLAAYEAKACCATFALNVIEIAGGGKAVAHRTALVSGTLRVPFRLLVLLYLRDACVSANIGVRSR